MPWRRSLMNIAGSEDVETVFPDCAPFSRCHGSADLHVIHAPWSGPSGAFVRRLLEGLGEIGWRGCVRIYDIDVVNAAPAGPFHASLGAAPQGYGELFVGEEGELVALTDCKRGFGPLIDWLGRSEAYAALARRLGEGLWAEFGHPPKERLAPGHLELRRRYRRALADDDLGLAAKLRARLAREFGDAQP